MLEQYLTQANITALQLEGIPAESREEFFSCKKKLSEQIEQALNYIESEHIPLGEVRYKEDEILKRLLIKRDEKKAIESLRKAEEEAKALSAQYGDVILKKYDMDTFLSVKKEMDEFKRVFAASSRTEKKALMPKFLEMDERYKKAKQKISRFADTPAELDEASGEYESKLRKIMEKKEAAEKALSLRNSDSPLSSRPSGSGAVTSFILSNGGSSPMPIESNPEKAAVSSQVEAVTSEEIAKLDERMNILTQRIDMSKIGKLPSDRTDIIIEKLKLQSDLEVAKLRVSVERFKREISAEMDKLSEEINAIKETVMTIKADAESVRVSAEIARKAKNAAAMNAQKAAIIAKRLAAIVRYLSPDNK